MQHRRTSDEPKENRPLQRLTDRYVQSLKPTDKRLYIRDRELAGLELQVTPTGAKTYYYCYRELGANKRYKLGSSKLLGASDARRMAKDVMIKLRLGENLQPDAGAVTVRELIERYIEHAETIKKLSPATLGNYKGELTRMSRRILNAPAEEVSLLQAHNEFDAATKRGPVVANRMLALVKAAYTHAINRGQIRINPFACIQKNVEKPRKVFIPIDTLPDFWAELMNERWNGDIDAADCIALMLFTGLRVGNALNITWSNVCLDTGRLYVPKTKNGDEAVVFCSDLMLSMIRARHEFKEGKYLFSGRRSVRYAMARINTNLSKNNLSIQGLCAHAMRHTFTNVARRVVEDLKLIEVMTSHRSRSLTVNTYMHLEETELKDAFDTVGGELVRLSRIERSCFDVVMDSG